MRAIPFYNIWRNPIMTIIYSSCMFSNITCTKPVKNYRKNMIICANKAAIIKQPLVWLFFANSNICKSSTTITIIIWTTLKTSICKIWYILTALRTGCTWWISSSHCGNNLIYTSKWYRKCFCCISYSRCMDTPLEYTNPQMQLQTHYDLH